MSFFGPGTLSGYQPSTTDSGLSPEVVQALMKQFPSLAQGQQTAPTTLATLGYQSPGVQLFSGQGTGSFGNALSPFEGAGGVSPESITGGLAMGSFGKSSSQQPVGGGTFGNLSLPSLSLPMAQVASAQASAAGNEGLGGGDTSASSAPAGNSGGVGLGDLTGAAGKAIDLFGAGSLGTQSDLQGSSPQAYQQQRAGERDLSTLGGSFYQPPPINGIPLPALNLSGPGGPSSTVFQGGPNPTAIFGQEAAPSLGAPTLNPQLPNAAMPNVNDVLGGVNGGETSLAAPGGSAQFALGDTTQPTDWMGALQGGVQAAGGLLGAVGGFGSGNVLGGTMGGLQTLGGVTQMLQSSPALQSALGINADALSGVGGAVGGIGGLYSLYQGIQTGDPMQIVSGLMAAYNGGSAVAGQLLGAALPSLSTAFASLAPEAAMSIATMFGGQAASAAAEAALAAGATSAEAAGTALSAAIGGVAAVAAPIVMAIVSYVSEADKRQMLQSGYINNPIAGQLYSNATAGVHNVQQSLDQLQQAGGANAETPLQLGDLLTSGFNNLLPYYQTAQGPLGGIRASDTITGMFGRQGIGGADQYTQNFNTARQGLLDVMANMTGRGVPADALMSLPVTGDYTQRNLDMDPAWLANYYQANAGQYNQEAQGLIDKLLGAATQTPVMNTTSMGEGTLTSPTGQMAYSFNGTPFDPSQITPQALFTAMQGAAPYGENYKTNASDLVTNMFGGPLGAALAREYYNPANATSWSSQQGQLPSLSFDPWVQARNMSPDQLWQALTSNGAINPQNQVAPTNVNLGPVGVGHFTGMQAGSQNPYWQQQIGQQAAADPVAQQLQRYMQQLSQLQGALPQLNQSAQTASMSGIDPALAAALQPSGFAGGNGAFDPSGGGGLDLYALLKQMGYAA